MKKCPALSSVPDASASLAAFVLDASRACSPPLFSLLISRFVTPWQILTYTCDEKLLRSDLKSKFVQLQASEQTFAFIKAHPPHGLAGSYPPPS